MPRACAWLLWASEPWTSLRHTSTVKNLARHSGARTPHHLGLAQNIWPATTLSGIISFTASGEHYELLGSSTTFEPHTKAVQHLFLSGMCSPDSQPQTRSKVLLSNLGADDSDCLKGFKESNNRFWQEIQRAKLQVLFQTCCFKLLQQQII